MPYHDACVTEASRHFLGVICFATLVAVARKATSCMCEAHFDYSSSFSPGGWAGISLVSVRRDGVVSRLGGKEKMPLWVAGATCGTEYCPNKASDAGSALMSLLVSSSRSPKHILVKRPLIFKCGSVSYLAFELGSGPEW